MDKILRGYHTFRKDVYTKQRDFFRHIAARRQEPKALFITCSDARIDPTLLTQTDPGDLFILRNTGNIIPPYGAAGEGEVATIEYAVSVLGIRNIILCGHTPCGAMQALLDFEKSPPPHGKFKGVLSWFAFAEATRHMLAERYRDLSGDQLLDVAVEENVLAQLNHLSTHPVVAVGLAKGDLKLFGWRYEIESGTIYEYDQSVGRFAALGDTLHPAVPTSVRQSTEQPPKP